MKIKRTYHRGPLMLIIARHAESGFNGQNRIQGHMDSKLTSRGLGQAKILSRRLAAMKITRIYSSDLGRAVATTREIARRLRMPIIRDARLREIRLGRWEGLTPEEVTEGEKSVLELLNAMGTAPPELNADLKDD